MKIITKDSSIIESIFRQFLEQLEKKLEEKAPIIEARIREINFSLWKMTKTYDSLINGQLTHEFGIPQGEAPSRVDAILERISKSMAVRVKKFPKRGKRYIGLRLYILRSPIRSQIFDMPEAIVETEKEMTSQFSNDFAAFSGGENISGGTGLGPKRDLPWLQWLLKEGNKFIIIGYRYEDIVDARSRSGKGLMIPDDTTSWRVPPEYSGTSNDNWLTRTLLEDRKFLIGEYGRIINEVLES